jgi:predicted DCC family thiol-disulfide oxidoreductase YuxK
MKTLYVLYDGKCAICRRLRAWLGQQIAYVPLAFIPLQAPDIEQRFPGIGALHPDAELFVISDEGEMWRGERAWIICLWALREYREWSQRLAHPALLPFARRACALISENRHALSGWFEGHTPVEVGEKLAAFSEPCRNTGYCRPS